MPSTINWFIGGAKRDKRDHNDFRAAGITVPITLPDEFGLDYPYKVKHQNGFPSCVAQSTAAHKQRQEGAELSARFIYAMAKQKYDNGVGWGTSTRNGFKVLTEYGVSAEKDYPETHGIPESEYIALPDPAVIGVAKKHRSRTYWRIDTWEGIKQTIFQHQEAVVLAIPWYENFSRPATDLFSDAAVLPEDKGRELYGHAVTVLGWRELGFLCLNSWGKNWGINGYFILPYKVAESLPWFDVWTSLDLEKEYPVDYRYKQPRTWQSFLGEQRAAFNPWLYKQIKRLPSPREINGLYYGKHPFETIFRGAQGDRWLFKTKIELSL